MRIAPSLPTSLLLMLGRQEGVVTTAQALGCGLTRRQLRTLVAAGWGHPTRGVYVAPHAADPFRASVRAALLACPSGVVCGVTAARIHRLRGLPEWTPAEEPHLILPAGRGYNTRSGVRLHSGLRRGEQTVAGECPTTTLARTVDDLACLLAPDDLVCLLDCALRSGWRPGPSSSRSQRKLRAALALSDARSESPFETRLRLLLVRAGLAPETLQLEVLDAAGRVYARLDMAWPSVKLAVEADGRAHHDAPQALYRDRIRANDLELAGWTILRFTWADLHRRPAWVIAQVRRGLN